MALRTIRADALVSTPLGSAMKDIRIWLDCEKIQPVQFRTVVGRAGVGFEISFRDRNEAKRFERRFASLMSETLTL
jgi:hypothetical protein